MCFPYHYGVVHLPRQELYRQQAHALLHVTQMPEIMSLVQFEHIRRLLIQNKKQQILQGQPGHNKLYVPGFLDLLPERMQPVY